jgi:hypothetical protein
MRVILRRSAAAVVVVAGLSAVWWGPLLLRRADWFEVRRVEVSGVRLLGPHEVLAAAGLPRNSANVWDAYEPIVEALRAHPMIEDAQVERRLPGTLRIRVTEKRPVALVEAPVLRAATATAELLAIEPAGRRVDLPLVRLAPVSGEPDSAYLVRLQPLLAEVGRLAQLDPELLGRTSEVRLEQDGVLRLVLARPRADVLVGIGADAPRLRQLLGVLQELELRADPGAAPAGRVQVDLRFEGQVVLRYPKSV